ncbi:hypothetical protein CHUAL_010856 [Chamberlinius hualienensis]
MLDVLSKLKDFAAKVRHLQVDNGVFQLHYRFTVLILLAFSILVTSKQYIGDPIDCTSPAKLRENVIDQYCWVSSTHSVPNACHKKVGTEVIYPCIDKHVDGQEYVSHQYYQWVCFVLFLQALMFYFPHYLWKSWESGRLKALTLDLDGPLVDDKVKEQRIKALTAYFNVSLHRHNFYAARYVVCEILNFINVVGQMFLTNRFLGGTFLTYGTEVIQFTQLDQLDRTDPMMMIFPRVTKCTFHTFGPGGNPQNHDAVCVLPINIINEKIYIVLWFWFIFLAIASGLAIIYRIVTIISPEIRSQLLRARATSVKRRVVEDITKKIMFGDWFLLYLLSKNINSYIFKDVADVVAKNLDGYHDGEEIQKLNDKNDKMPL